MLNGSNIILYSTDAEADRAFIRDVLEFTNVDAGNGWLIFKLPPAEIAAISLPSGADLPRYQPRHPTAYDLKG